MQLHGIEFGAFGRQLLFQMPRECEIDIVAAKQDMLSHRDAFQREFARLFGYRDQREVRGAAADIDHQNQVANSNALAPIGVPLDPGIERSLRFFEQQ